MRRAATIGHRTDARTIALAVSVLFHAAALLILAHYLARTEVYAEAPAIQVVLVPRTAPREPRRAERPPPPDRRPARAIAPHIATTVPADVAPLPLPPAPAAPDVAAQGQRVLRGLAACDPARMPHLPAAERERCEARQAARAAPGRLNLDPSGRYVESDEPFLSRRPKNGCRARATGDVSPGGDSGNVRAGVGCAFAF